MSQYFRILRNPFLLSESASYQQQLFWPKGRWVLQEKASFAEGIYEILLMKSLGKVWSMAISET